MPPFAVMVRYSRARRSFNNPQLTRARRRAAAVPLARDARHATTVLQLQHTQRHTTTVLHVQRLRRQGRALARQLPNECSLLSNR